MSGYVPNDPKGYRNKGIEPVDLGAQRWAEYKELPPTAEEKPKPVGCTFTKPCKLPDGVINYASVFIPTDSIAEYGQLTLLGWREIDVAGNVKLGTISGRALPPAMGTIVLGSAGASGAAATGAVVMEGAAKAITVIEEIGVLSAGVVSSTLLGVIAMLWPSSLGDSSLYTDEQLKSLKEGRTRVRLHIEQQTDGSLKGYGYNTEKRRDWEMIPVVQFEAQGSHQVADFGNGITLIWTPAVDPSGTAGIPPLEGAPQAPQIWIYPPTEQADNIIVNPLYPPEYKDFILVFPPEAGIQPLYIVLSVPGGLGYHRAPDVLPAFPDAVSVRPKSFVQGGGSKRDRWKDSKGRIYEWDYQHGAVEIYDKQGKHLGEFNAETGKQTKPAKPGRTTIK
ncbi:Colicin E3 [Pseudomonas chlororaphis subsp. aurantiaca]|uniref:colicin E3/pyocin S6 family cytotoxin n=1 Tax=Pseudomonas chlororaphis TaxID=587753 RepID=UPI000F5652EC|nr:colicin E3/pyocin S6 family cytotoxin [Pseudomonas chlororaphis]AZD23024.1 Colicin E3 [Pseudomonas chlororaphis subsp. aurantiaca]